MREAQLRRLNRTLPVITDPATVEAVIALVGAAEVYRESVDTLVGEAAEGEVYAAIRSNWGDVLDMAEGIVEAWHKHLGLTKPSDLD